MSDDTKGEFGEPWSVTPYGDNHVIKISDQGRNPDPLVVAKIQDDEFADRIIACVNFLAGVPTEWLLRRAEGRPQFINSKPIAELSFPMTPLKTNPYVVLK